MTLQTISDQLVALREEAETAPRWQTYLKIQMLEGRRDDLLKTMRPTVIR